MRLLHSWYTGWSRGRTPSSERSSATCLLASMPSPGVYVITTATALPATTPATSRSHILHEKRALQSRQWVKRQAVPTGKELPVRIGLTQSNLDTVEDLLLDVSNHNSPNYGKYYSEQQIHDLFAPADKTVAAIHAWLESAGIHNKAQSYNKQWMQFDVTVEQLEALLKTKYYEYEHVKSGEIHVACDEYYIPDTLIDHIDYITPGIRLMSSQPVKASASANIEKRTEFKLVHQPRPVPEDRIMTAATDNGCDEMITPACIRTLYNFTVPTYADGYENAFGIFEGLNDIYDQADLDLFFTNVAGNIPAGTAPYDHSIDGAITPTTQSLSGSESLLDFAIAYPIVYPQDIVLFQTDDNFYEANYNFNGFLNNFFDGIDGSYCNYTKFGETGNSDSDPSYPDLNAGGFTGQLQCGAWPATDVISISYGAPEYDIPVSYQRRQCAEIAKLGMRGISVIVASGDSGVAGGGDSCIGEDSTVFSPGFPGTCPYLTCVGSTSLPPGSETIPEAQVATTNFGSGGGFSNIYTSPNYQRDHIASWFAADPPPYPFYNTTHEGKGFETNGGIWNRNGRGFPDISALGDNIVYFQNGTQSLIGGTSAAAPLFASLLVRINIERRAVGKGPVGFVNPTIYAHPEAFTDITTGTNPGCSTDGFEAVVGWDPVSGLGSPNYPALLDLFMSMP